MTRAGVAALGLAAAISGCGPPLPEPHVRVAAWAPQGSDAPPDAVASVDFTGEVSPDGLVDGRRVALARAADARAVAAAVESETGLAAGAPVVASAASLEPGGRRLLLRPLAPLAAGAAYAIVLGPARDAAGRPVLDPEGHRRAFVATFSTAPPPPGPPPRPAITEVRAVAASPQAGGEYVEVWNLGEGPLALAGWRLAKRTSSGALASCELVPAAGEPSVAPGGAALVTGGAWDGRYDLPLGLPRFGCGASALAGGLADDRPPEVRLVDPAGAVQATLGEGGVAPRCPAAVERILPAGPDAAENLACAVGEGTPGRCNSVTPAGACP